MKFFRCRRFGRHITEWYNFKMNNCTTFCNKLAGKMVAGGGLKLGLSYTRADPFIWSTNVSSSCLLIPGKSG